MEVGICCRYVCLFEGEWGTGDIEPYLGYGCQKVFLGFLHLRDQGTYSRVPGTGDLGCFVGYRVWIRQGMTDRYRYLKGISGLRGIIYHTHWIREYTGLYRWHWLGARSLRRGCLGVG
jgi:hypothetical protein